MSKWDLDKKKQFCATMGKGRAKFAKGGLIRRVGNRKYFDNGGNVSALNAPPPAPLLTGPTTVGQGNASNPNTGILGTIGGALGLNNNFQASGANINQGTNAGQLNAAYSGAQTGLQGQTELANQLTPQVPGAVSNQQAVAAQELAMSRGEGPNPAQAELNQATGQNVENQAALMAGQRGAGANAGLMARNIANQGAKTQQQAAGQAATLEAQQQIAAQERLANLSNQQINQTGQAVQAVNTGQQNEQNILQNANTAANNAAVGMQSNINNTNAQTSAANQGMAGGILGGIAGAASSVLGGLFAEGGEVKPHHVTLAEMNAASLMHTKKFADGGPIVGNPLDAGPKPSSGANPNWAGSYFGSGAENGPNIETTQALPQNSTDFSDIGSQIGDSLNPNGKSGSATNRTDSQVKSDYAEADQMLGGKNKTVMLGDNDPFNTYAQGGEIAVGPHKSHVANFLMAKGGAVPAMVSPGEVYLSPDKVQKVIREGANPMKIGARIGGKAKIKGDSLKNDTVPMTLEEGGVVIPRHIATHKMNAEKAELFVHRAIARKKARA